MQQERGGTISARTRAALTTLGTQDRRSMRSTSQRLRDAVTCGNVTRDRSTQAAVQRPDLRRYAGPTSRERNLYQPRDALTRGYTPAWYKLPTGGEVNFPRVRFRQLLPMCQIGVLRLEGVVLWLVVVRV